ncbi:MAG: hypothetical protein AAGF11_04575 [Myxococcota bacterium]
MIINLYSQALVDDNAQLDLMAVVWAALQRGHILLTDPPYSGASASHPVERWLAPLPAPIAEDVRLLLESHTVQATTTPYQTTLHVHESGHELELSWPDLHLPCDRAAAFALRPLSVLLEDRRSDRAFLLAVAPRRWRQELERALHDGALEILNGGGLGNMLHQVREHCDAETAARLWVLFDSDADEPGAPSRDSNRLQQECESLRAHGLGHHQLRARSIENYLPLELLKTWASTVGDDAPSKVDRISAMGQQRRDHLRLKDELGKGLIADLFIRYQFQIEESWLRREGHYDEIREICESIIAHI